MTEDKNIPVPVVRTVKKNKYATVVHFPHMEYDKVLEILNNIRANKSRRYISRKYDVSCYYLIKILKFFKDCQNTEDIKKIFDDIYEKNHIVKPIDHALNYKNNKEYYKKYSSDRYAKMKQLKLDEINNMYKAEQEILCTM